MNNDLTKTTQLLDELSEMIDSSQNSFLFSKSIKIDGERAKEIIKEIHLSLPRGMQVAETVLEEREKIESEAMKRFNATIDKAQIEAKNMLLMARKEAGRLVSEDVITNESRKVAHHIVNEAIEISNTLKAGANKYFHSIIDKLEDDVLATETKIAELSKELAKHREYLDINRAKLDQFTEEFDKNIELAHLRLNEVIVEQMNKLTESGDYSPQKSAPERDEEE